jgi:AcrR family transcriptional regulator
MAKRPKPVRGRIVDGAVALAEERRWRDVGLGDIAERSGVSLSQLHREFGSTAAIVAEIMRRTDEAVVAGRDPSSDGEPAHDRVLDALLRRFDALAPMKSALASIMRDMPADPMGLLCLAPRFYRSMGWTLESAGIGTSGLAGRLRVKGVSAIYAAAFRVWLRDDSKDLTKTMAFLDKRLSQGERFAALLPFGIVDSRPRADTNR